MEQQLICIAKVSGVQGLAGEMKVISLSDNPDRLSAMIGKQLTWRRDGEFRLVNVKAVRSGGKMIFLSLAGVSTRESAQTFVGGELVVPESELLPLPPGSFYIYQLVGMNVYDETGRTLGALTEVLQPGSNDVYVVEGPFGKILIPALKTVVKRVDLSLREMHVELPTGLMDEK